jgi:hypothetical protein
MPEALTSGFGAEPVYWGDLILRLGLAFAYGVLVAWAYRWVRGRATEAGNFLATLVLLTLLIAAVSTIIGDNVARAFSLVGALSIVRFRTVVEDTRDTAFVILAVGVGMAVGAGHHLLPIALLPLAAVAAKAFSSRWPAKPDCEVIVRSGPGVPDAQLTGVLAARLDCPHTQSAATARQGAALETVVVGRLKPGVTLRSLFDAASAIEGVMSVEVRRLP